jgi:topoisomerase-4 subunit A
VSTEWRPVAKVSFAKDRGKERRDDQEIDIEQFIGLKGVSALGNQLTKLKVNQIDLIESLPYEAPIQLVADEIDVVEEDVLIQSEKKIEVIKEVEPAQESTSTNTVEQAPKTTDLDLDVNDEGQITLF